MCTGRGHKHLLLQEVKGCHDITKELRVVPYGELDSNRFLLCFFTQPILMHTIVHPGNLL